MAYTSFGEFVRILRIRNHEVMGDMAKFLGTSVAFLSSVENGKKNVPIHWASQIADHYRLTDLEIAELNRAIEESKTQMKLILTGSSNIKRSMALQVARSFDGMDDETAEKIIKLLEGQSL